MIARAAAPLLDWSIDLPRRRTVADVELNRSYAVVMSTPACLWSYVLGDTVRFTRGDPLRLVITGRTRHYVNAFGENVIVEEVESAAFARIIDETLIALSADYRAKRTGAVGLVAPIVTPLPAGTFHQWVRARGQLGDQHKVPGATNDRAIADALLAIAPGAAWTEPADEAVQATASLGGVAQPSRQGHVGDTSARYAPACDGP